MVADTKFLKNLSMPFIHNHSQYWWLQNIRHDRLVCLVLTSLFFLGCCDVVENTAKDVISTGRPVEVNLSTGYKISVQTWLFSRSEHLKVVAGRLREYNQQQVDRIVGKLKTDIPIDEIRSLLKIELAERQQGYWGFVDFDRNPKIACFPLLLTGNDGQRGWLIIARSNNIDLIALAQGSESVQPLEIIDLIKRYAVWITDHAEEEIIRNRLSESEYLNVHGEIVIDDIVDAIGLTEFPEQN